VISPWLISCDASLSENGAQSSCRNRLAPRKNPIPALKKKNSNSDRQAPVKDSPLSRIQDRFARRENPPNTQGVPLLCKRRNRGENGRTVTSNHLLLQRQPGKSSASLPISRPNCNFLWRKSNERPLGGRGGQLDASAESVISITSHGNFIRNGPLINS
jgi:hypothetical protein